MATLPPSTTRPEHELLICVARVTLGPDKSSRVRALLAEDLDWAYLLRLARGHGLMPLLYWHLKHTCPEAVPEGPLAELRTYFNDNHKRNIYLAGELLKLLRLLAEQGIIAIPYKGPAVAVSVYGNLALRRFSDLDILVRKYDVARARQLLEDNGYVPELKVPAAHEADFVRVNYVQLFNRRDERVVVELHWGVAPRVFAFPLKPEALWARLSVGTLLGAPIPTLAPEDLLLLLCVHGAKDWWDRLEWVCGVAELVRNTQLDWPLLLARAAALSSARMLYLGLFLAHDLLEAPLPEWVWQRVGTDAAVRSLAATVGGRLFIAAEERCYSLSFRSAFHVRAKENMLDRLRYCFRLATTATYEDWEFVALPASFSFAYPFLRPLRLLRKYWLQPPRD